MRYMIISLVLLFSSLMVSAAELELRSFSISDQGTLEVMVPNSWNDSEIQTSGEEPPTIMFAPETGAQFRVAISLVLVTNPNGKLPTSDEIRSSVKNSAERLEPQSIEKHLEVKKFTGSANIGFYYSATDPAPKPDEYKYLSQGMLLVKDILIAFTILTNDGQDDIVKEAFALLASAQRKKII